MIEIYEINDSERIDKLNKQFGQAATKLDRVFVEEEDGDVGMGILALSGSVVVLKAACVKEGLSFFHYDLLVRSLLNVASGFSPIPVRVYSKDKYFEGFGFKACGEYMEILSTDINLKGYCGRK